MERVAGSKDVVTTPEADNPLAALTELGQSLWIDSLDRRGILSGELQSHIDRDSLRGATSNPTIFDKAITGHSDDDSYNQPIRELTAAGRKPGEIYELLATHDVQMACDAFRPVYDRLNGRDGFVSIEVSPGIAYDTGATIFEARRLWSEVNRPNLMIKVPATEAGLPAITRLTDEGINVNITLLFGLDRYQAVVDAYLAGLEARAARGQSLRISSVASFFLSRIDVLIDAKLDALEKAGRVAPATGQRFRGRLAIASARVAYQMYEEAFHSDARFRRLAEQGARPQRLLWASTGTKNPAYSDVMYVEALIGEETINTVPLETLQAYRDHGQPARRIANDLDEASALLQELEPATHVSLAEVTQELERDGVRKFNDSYAHVLQTIADRGRGFGAAGTVH
jgi:transaldolase